MTPEQREIRDLKRRLAKLEKFIVIDANRIRLRKTVIVDGILNADRVLTQRSGSYVELTS